MNTITKLFIIALLASSVLTGCLATTGGDYSGYSYNSSSHGYDKHY